MFYEKNYSNFGSGVRALTLDEINFVSAGLASDPDPYAGARDIAAGLGIVAATVIGVAALPAEAPALAVYAGIAVAGAAAGVEFGIGIAELADGTTGDQQSIEIVGGHDPSAQECRDNPGISDICGSDNSGGGANYSDGADGNAYYDEQFVSND